MTEHLTVFWDESFLEHEPPAGEFERERTDRLAVEEAHPDRHERVRNIRHIIDHELSEHRSWAGVTPASRAALERVHDAEYVDEFEAFCDRGGGRLTPTTGANAASFTAARHAAGAAISAAEHAIEDDGSSVPYALVRPSGHHAQPAQADGFCFFNNVAIAAEAALESPSIDKVAILDWDVHHGNGTQEVFYDRDDVLFISLHNDHGSWGPAYHPQTGNRDEHGVGAGTGYNVNVPLPPGTGNDGYEHAITEVVEPVLAEFDADLLLVSAGQDPGIIDPLGRNLVTKPGFEMLGAHARRLAANYTGNRLALIQEGGYQVSHLAYATLGVLEGVLGIETGVEDPFAWLTEEPGVATDAIAESRADLAEYWPLS